MTELLKALGGVVLAAILMFVWGMASWMVLPMHDATMDTFQDEPAMMQAIAEQTPQTGVYTFPTPPKDWSDATAMADFTERHRQGPVGVLYVHKNPGDPMPPTMMVTGFALNAACALLLYVLLRMAKLKWLGTRWLFAIVVGVLIAAASDGAYYVWMYYPWDYSLVMALDDVMNYILAGAVLAFVTAPKQGEESPVSASA